MQNIERRTLLVGLAAAAWALLPATAVFAQRHLVARQQADPGFSTTVLAPVYESNHPVVLFDQAHDNFHTAGGRYKPFADLMASDGYRVEPNQKAFTPHSLSRGKVLAIANAMPQAGNPGMSAFTLAECQAVEHWVRQGGSLLLITDHPPFGTAAALLAGQFGVAMSQGIADDPAHAAASGLLFARDGGQLGDHPILTGRDDAERIDRVLTFTGQSLLGPPGSTPLLKLAETATDRGPGGFVSAAGRSQGLALRHGKGRVVVMGEAADLTAQLFPGNPLRPVGMNVPGSDNRQLALNIMHWLSGLME